jgi:hypothetical protein
MVGAVSMDPCRGAGEVDTGTVITVVPVSGAGGGPAPRETCQRIRLPSPLALFSLYTSRTAGVPLLDVAERLSGVHHH